MSLYPKDNLQIRFLTSVIQKTIITDLLKSERQYMHHDPVDELCIGNGDLFDTTVFIVFCRKSYIGFIHFKYTGIRDCNAVGISSEIFNGISKTIEGFLYIGAPLFPLEGITQFIPDITVL